MKRKVGIWLVLVAILLSVAIPAVSCAPAQPAAAKEIKVGMMGGLTAGPVAAVVTLIQEWEYAMRYVNEVEGGISGYKFTYKTVDSKSTPDGAVVAYKELRDSFNPAIFLAMEDYLLLGIKDQIVQDKSTIFGPAAVDPRLEVPPGRFFTYSIPIADGFAGYVRWVMTDWKKSGQPKIGLLYWDRPSGQQWQAAEALVKKLGVQLVPISYPIQSTDLKPQLLALRDANVDYIWMLGVAQAAAAVVRDARALGLAGKIPITFNEYVETQVVLSLVGADAEGFYSYGGESPFSDGAQAAKLYSDIYKWAKNENKWSDNRGNIVVKAVLTAAAKQAIADAKGANIDGEAMFNALTKLTNIDTWGNNKDFGYGLAKRVGVSTMKIRKFTKDGTVSASDWISLPRIYEGVDK